MQEDGATDRRRETQMWTLKFQLGPLAYRVLSVLFAVGGERVLPWGPVYEEPSAVQVLELEIQG